MTRQAEQDGKNRTAMTGVARKGAPSPDYIRQPGRHQKYGRAGEAKEDRQNLKSDWTSRTGQAEQNCQDRTARTGLPVHDCLEKTARAG
jgi:hypothetical protein